MINLTTALIECDEKWARAGVPPLSERWRTELCAFYGSGCTVHAARIGRGGAKSTASAKCLVVETLAGAWKVPPGERHWALNISENLDEARARLGQIEEYLSILSVPFDRVGDQIHLRRKPLGFWSRAARIGALKGPRVVAWSVDEAATMSVEGVNPAAELEASLKAASVTHPGARGRLYSSPWGKSDHHYDVIEAGTTSHVFVSLGPSWEYNPAITEAQTHALEPSQSKWSREYLAVPSETTTSTFDEADIAACVSIKIPRGDQLSTPLIVIDSSMGGGDSFCFGSACWALVDKDIRPHLMGTHTDPEGTLPTSDSWVIRDAAGNAIPNPRYNAGRQVLVVADLVEYAGQFARTVTADQIVAQIAKLAKSYGTTRAIGDNYQRYMMDAALMRYGIRYDALTWTNENKAIAVARIGQWLRERTLVVAKSPEADRLADQLRSFEQTILPSGAVSFGARRGKHDDLVALLINLAMVDTSSGGMSGSPIRKRYGAIDMTPHGAGTF